MNIEDFVSETLTQITNGICKAQKKTKETGVCISPRMNNKHVFSNECVEHDYASHVEFDIAVEVSEEKDESTSDGAKGRIGIANLISVSIGGSSKKEDTSSNKNLSRIKFSIPVCWPLQPFVDKWYRYNPEQISNKDEYDPLESQRSRPY